MLKIGKLLWKWRGALVTPPSVAAFVILGECFGLFQFLEWTAIDQFFRLRQAEPADSRIAIVSIGEKDITRVGKWPFPDGVIAELLEKVKAQKPRAIGLDLYRDLPVEPSRQALVAAFKSAPNLIGVEKALGQTVAPAPTLGELGQVGMADMVLDADGKVRRALISAGTRDGKIKLGLAAKLALMYLKTEGITPQPSGNNQLKLGKAVFVPLRRNQGGYVRGDTGGYQILLNYRGVGCRSATEPCPFASISMTDVLENRIPPGLMRDRIVLIGSIAPSLNDFFQTPYSSTLFQTPSPTPGVAIHANISSQILSAAIDGRPLLRVWPNHLNWLWILAWSVTGSAVNWMLLRVQPFGKNAFFAGTVPTAFLTGLALTSISYLSFLWGWVIPVVSPLVAACASAIAIASYRNQQQLKSANEQLQKANAQLEEYSLSLENKVEERTRELETAKKAADAASAAKSEFLSNMSHELRTPLNGILGYAQILQRDKSLAGKQRDSVRIIEQCGSHLLNLINDILDLSKIEARKMELYPKDFHFPSFLQGVTQMCRIKAEQKEIAFTFQEINQLPAALYADEKRLRQVLINLLGNAIKFTETGGVTFKVGVLERRAPQESGQGKIYKLRFQIEDTGTGMSPEQLDKIFLPFEQVGDSSRKAEGTGLGLAISKKIVNMMGSQLEVSSQKGAGSTFWFDADLPESLNCIESAPDSPASSIIGYRGEKQRILVVDDRWENRSVFVNLLEPVGFELAEAGSGREGLERAAEFNPHLIIIDLVMPEMDGFEMVQHLRSLPPFKDVPAIASSASVVNFNRERSRQAGCSDFLPKPVQAAELFEQLQKYLQLEWIYETEERGGRNKEEKSRKDEKIVAPPLERLLVLYKAAQIGDIEAVEREASRLSQLDAKYRSFAARVLQLAEEFEDQKIVKLIDPYLGD
jgi:CHASE2 domain-containing sensor protein/CheY-like chemotaxis protein/nitrogen-specific signal transduction histidine kinase